MNRQSDNPEPLDLDALKAICDKATPGEWRHVPGGKTDINEVTTKFPSHLTQRFRDAEGRSVTRYIADATGANAASDMDFIAAARSALPRLIERAREQQETIDEIIKTVDAHWSFNSYQQHTHSWHEKNHCMDLIRKLAKGATP